MTRDQARPAGGICPGSCNNAYRRAQALYQAAVAQHEATLARLVEGDPVPDAPSPPRLRAWLGDPVWCARCCAIIRAALAEIDDLAAMVAALPPGIRPAVDTTHDRVKVSGSKPVASPSPAADTLDDLAGWLRHWEARARGTDERPRRGYLATEITIITSWLVAHLDRLLIRVDVAEQFGTQTTRWHRELISVSHAAREAKHVKKPCPGCKRYTLWERPGEAYIACVYQDCNRRITRDELDKIP